MMSKAPSKFDRYLPSLCKHPEINIRGNIYNIYIYIYICTYTYTYIYLFNIYSNMVANVNIQNF